MLLNYLRLTKISTNLTLLTFSLFSLGLILSITDEILGWDVLPDFIEKYAQLIIIFCGIVVSFFIVSSVICSLTAIVELMAGKVNLAQEKPAFSRRKKIIFSGVVIAIISTFFVLQQIDTYRKQQIFARDVEHFAQRLQKNAQQLEEALIKVLPSFPKDLLQKMGNQTLLDNAGDFKELSDFITAVSLSITDNPEVMLLTRSNAPYNYLVISAVEQPRDFYGEEDTAKYKLNKQPYLRFSRELENQIVENLFKESLSPLMEPFTGDFIDNTEPSSWGILKLEGRVVAILLLKKSIDTYYTEQLREKKTFNHHGPTKIYSNFPESTPPN